MIAVKPHVLVVEDDASLVHFLTLLLEDGGYQVTALTAPAAAAACLDGGTFDLVLMDSFSPTPDGVFAATSVIRPAAGSTSVILLTGHRVDPIAAGAAGCAGVLQKPFDIDDLFACLRNVLRPVPLS